MTEPTDGPSPTDASRPIPPPSTGGTPPTGGEPPPQSPPAGSGPPTQPPPAGATPPVPAPSAWQPPTPASSSDFGVPVAAGPAPGIVYADLIQRIIALVIDAVVLGVGYAIVWAVLVATMFAVGSFEGALSATVVGGLVYLLASAIYFTYTWTTMRASPGQRILGLQTVNAADGSTISREQAIRRWGYLWGPSALATAFGYSSAALGLLGVFVSLASAAYLLFLLYSASQSPKRQGYHDVQARTVVIKRI